MNRWISYVISLVLAACLAVSCPLLGGMAVAAGLVMPLLVRHKRRV